MLAAFLGTLANAAALPVQASAGKTAVSLSPHLTELVYAAGAGEHLLGVSDASNYPPAATRLPKVGNGVAPNAERIAVLRPDVILAWGYKNSKGLYPALNNLHIPIRYQAPKTLDDIIRDINALGILFDTQATAHATTQALQVIVDSERARYRDAARVNIFILVSREPLYTLGVNSFVIDALHACGAVSVFEALAAPAPLVSREQLLMARPQAVLFAGKEIASEAKSIGDYFSGLGLALNPEQIIGQDPDVLFRPTDRLIRSLPLLCSAIDQIRRRAAPALSVLPLPPQPRLP